MNDSKETKIHPRFLASRRDFLRFVALGGAAVGLFAGAGRISPPLWEQYATWQEVNCDAATFRQKYAKKLIP
jgi:hypothetical protein